MKFGVREICDVIFKAKADVKIGNQTFKAGQPVLFIDSAKTSTLEGAATTVYATGGRGNTRLLAWEGEKTLTFTVEDALLSPIGFSILSGAGLIKGASASEDQVHVHMTSIATVTESTGKVIDLTEVLGADKICKTAPIFVALVEKDGTSLTGEIISGVTVEEGDQKLKFTSETVNAGDRVMVDYYILRNDSKVSELQIDADSFAGFFYVEASTLFRDQATGKDMPAQITLPKVKVQSNFTFTMASTGDPSTFTFTMDALPDYTYFNKEDKVLCAMQIIDDTVDNEKDFKSVFAHNKSKEVDSSSDSVEG